MRLLFCGSGWLPVVGLIEARLPPGTTIATWNRASPLVTAVADVDVLLPSNARITREVIESAPRLRLIQQPAAGTEGIDRDAAVARAIPVCNAPGSNHVAVAEATFYFLLALARRAPVAARAFADRQVGEPAGIELAGKTLGLVGRGRAGAAVAARAEAFGMTVRTLGRGATADDKRAFFAACDAISLHCPLTPETRGFVDAEAFAAMKPGALLINIARGAVVDRAALLAALATGRLGGVGLDVHWEEPPDPADPLYADPRVVALPHLGGSTVEAFSRIADVVAGNVRRLIAGEPLEHRVA
ncbi:MAG TPA: NAD(P)-dependent oxidoreductase [Kofleriaceae bacterium]|nr:NAD(P)-dependent oxidoreductase [Kofleriaceae bacterium]